MIARASPRLYGAVPEGEDGARNYRITELQSTMSCVAATKDRCKRSQLQSLDPSDTSLLLRAAACDLLGAMETPERRLERFLSGPPVEIMGTIVASMEFVFMPQIKIAVDHRCDFLVLIGTHAVIQVIADGILGRKGPAATKFFLKTFVDDATEPPDRTFSTIAVEMHELRNIASHQWLSKDGHHRAFDWDQPEGWKWVDNRLHVNLEIYFEQFRKGLTNRYSRYVSGLPPQEQLVRKYRALRQWLGLGREDSITLQIQQMQATHSLQLLQKREADVVASIRERFALPTK